MKKFYIIKLRTPENYYTGTLPDHQYPGINTICYTEDIRTAKSWDELGPAENELKKLNEHYGGEAVGIIKK